MRPAAPPFLLLALLALLVLPAASACTGPPPREEDLVVREDGVELLRIPAGPAPYPCTEPPRPEPVLDGRLLLWKGVAYDVDTGRSKVVGATASLGGGYAVTLGPTSATLHDVRNRTETERPVAGIPGLMRLAGPVVYGHDQSAPDAPFAVRDVIRDAWVVESGRPSGFGVPGNATLVGASRGWLAFSAPDLELWTVRLADRSVHHFFLASPWRFEGLRGDVLLSHYDLGQGSGSGYQSGRAAADPATGAHVPRTTAADGLGYAFEAKAASDTATPTSPTGAAPKTTAVSGTSSKDAPAMLPLAALGLVALALARRRLPPG